MKELFNQSSIKLVMLLTVLCLFSILAVKMNALFFLLILIAILSVYFIFKNKKNIHRKDIIVGMVLTVLCIPSNIIVGVFVLPAYLGSISILNKQADTVFFFNNGSKNYILKTFICIFIIGGVLSFINLFLMDVQLSINLDYMLQYLLASIGIGVYEEVLFRMLYFAICIYVLKDEKINKYQNILMYLVMILPHVLLHPEFNIASIIVLSLLFGLPFALMQRKVNLVSAIGSHALVDFIRFVFLGV